MKFLISLLFIFLGACSGGQEDVLPTNKATFAGNPEPPKPQKPAEVVGQYESVDISDDLINKTNIEKEYFEQECPRDEEAQAKATLSEGQLILENFISVDGVSQKLEMPVDGILMAGDLYTIRDSMEGTRVNCKAQITRLQYQLYVFLGCTLKDEKPCSVVMTHRVPITLDQKTQEPATQSATSTDDRDLEPPRIYLNAPPPPEPVTLPDRKLTPPPASDSIRRIEEEPSDTKPKRTSMADEVFDEVESGR